MSSSVFRSEQGRLAIQDYSRKVLASSECPLRQHDVPTSCGLTHVLEAGPPDGAPLVILHGTSTNAASWLGDLPVWGQSYRVLAVDMPGEPGLSADHRLGLSNGDVEQWLVDLLDAMGLERVSLVGMSLGGLVALRFAAHQPERVQALCLIAPAGLAPQRLSFPVKALPLTLLGDWGFRRINRMVWYDVEIPEVMLEFRSTRTILDYDHRHGHRARQRRDRPGETDDDGNGG